MAPPSSSDRLHPADVVVVLLVAFAIGVPFIRFTGFAGLHNSQRMAEVVVLALALSAAVTAGGSGVLRAGLGSLPIAARWGLGALVGLGLLSSVGAAVPLYALAEVGLLTVLVGLAVLVAGRWRSGDARAVIEPMVAAAATAAAGWIYVQHVRSVTGGGTGWPDVAFGFGNRRTLNQLQVVMLPVLVAMAADASSRAVTGWRRGVPWALRAVIAAQVGLYVASGGRAVLLGLGLGLGLVTVLYGRHLLAEAREWAVGLVAGALAYGAAFVGLGGGASFARREVTSNRDLLWESALRMAADAPWLGVGPMQFAFFETPNGEHPHNVVLQLAAEWGLPAAALAVGLVGWGVVAWVRAARATAGEPGRRRWRAALTVALVASLVSGLFDSFVMMPAPQVWGVLVLGALLAEYRRMVPPALLEVRSAPRVWRLAVVGLAVLVFSPVAAVTVRDAPTVERRGYDRRAWLPAIPIRPRFWQYGSIAPHEGPPREASARYWPAPLPAPTGLEGDISAR